MEQTRVQRPNYSAKSLRSTVDTPQRVSVVIATVAMAMIAMPGIVIAPTAAVAVPASGNAQAGRRDRHRNDKPTHTKSPMTFWTFEEAMVISVPNVRH
jgi:hypothetical protein